MFTFSENGKNLTRIQILAKIDRYREAGLIEEANEALAIFERNKLLQTERVKKFRERQQPESIQEYKAVQAVTSKVKKYYRTDTRQDTIKMHKLKAMRMLGNKCAHCGCLFPPAAMHFHHKDPKLKEFHVSGGNLTKPWEVIELEVLKCELLCSNCHEVHHTIVEWGRSMDVYNE